MNTRIGKCDTTINFLNRTRKHYLKNIKTMDKKQKQHYGIVFSVISNYILINYQREIDEKDYRDYDYHSLVKKGYIIADDEGIGIRALLRTIRIPYENIDHIERVSEDKPLLGATNTIRLLGVGGVFGYIGWFRTKGIGTYRSYVTNAKKSFLIYRTKGMPIAISVNEPDEFMPYYLKGGAK